MPHPLKKHPLTVQLSDADSLKIEAYASSQGLTLEEACTQLVRSAIKTKFVIRRPPSRVLPFQRKAKQ